MLGKIFFWYCKYEAMGVTTHTAHITFLLQTKFQDRILQCLWQFNSLTDDFALQFCSVFLGHSIFF